MCGEGRDGMVLTADYQLTRRDLLVMVAIIIAVLAAGAFLYAAGFNEAFHSGSEGVRGVFEVLTDLGNQTLYLVLLIIIYLSYDKGFGRRLCVLFFLTVYTTALLKQLFHDPRPPANLQREEPYTSYGFPSGHTTTSVTFYGYILLRHLRGARTRLPVLVSCAFAVVVVPVSRLVIGVHDVQDVAGGAVIALSALVVYVLLLPRVAPVVKGWPLGKQVVLGACGTLLLWLGGAAVLGLVHPGEVTQALEELAMGAGLLLGCAIAFPLEETLVDYRPGSLGLGMRVVATVIGLPVTLVTYIAMSVVGDLLLPAHAADLLTFAVLVIVLTLLVPMLLVRFVVGEGPVD